MLSWLPSEPRSKSRKLIGGMDYSQTNECADIIDRCWPFSDTVYHIGVYSLICTNIKTRDARHFAIVKYADILQLIRPIIDADTYICILFPHTLLQRSSSLFCSGIYIQYYDVYSYMCKRRKIFQVMLCKTHHTVCTDDICF